MSRLILLTYATESHKQIRKDLLFRAVESRQFDDFITYSPSDIDDNFYFKNEHILTLRNPEGTKVTGAFLWKPYIILKALNKVQDGDVILYMDCCDFFTGNTDKMKERVMEAMSGQDMILTTGGYKNKHWTRRDCFKYMGCDEPRFTDCVQLEAGIGLFRKTESTLRFVKEWLYFCQDIRIVSDGDPVGSNTCGEENYEGFMAHRHDQSILTNLCVRYGIPQGSILRNYITCNFATV